MKIYQTSSEKEFRPKSVGLGAGDFCVRKTASHCSLFLIDNDPLDNSVLENYPNKELFEIEQDIEDGLLFLFDGLSERQGKKQSLEQLRDKCRNQLIKSFFNTAVEILSNKQDKWDMVLYGSVMQICKGVESHNCETVEQEPEILIEEPVSKPMNLDIAIMYIDSDVEAEKEEGFKYVHSYSTKKCVPEAYYRLAYCYQNGIGTEKNISSAKFWYRKAYNKKHFAAAKAFAKILFEEKEDYYQAYDAFKTAAKGDDAESYYWMGWFYEKGLHDKADLSLAIKYYEIAAKYGYEDANKQLSLIAPNSAVCSESELEKLRKEDNPSQDLEKLVRLYTLLGLEIPAKEDMIAQLADCYLRDPELYIEKTWGDQKQSTSQSSIANSQEKVVKAFIKRNNLTYIDKTQTTNRMWIIGPCSLGLDKNTEFKSQRIKSVYMSEGSKLTQGKSAWQISFNRL